MKPALRLALPAFSLLAIAGTLAQASSEITLPDGSVYSGDVKNGLLDGSGELHWPDGRHYSGTFQDGMMSGKGSLTFIDGCTYVGALVRGELHGFGRYQCDDTYWEGNFDQGNLSRGTIFWQEFGTYEGEIQDFVAQGQGQLTYPDGTIVRATFEYGEPSGDGVRISKTATGELLEEPGYFFEGRYYASKNAWQEDDIHQMAAVEARLYSESERLQTALSALAPQRPGVRDVYLLAVGGDGTEGVFAREVNWVAERLGSVFDLKRHQIHLSNGSDNRPLATRTSVEKSLLALDAVMDPNEDLLLVHFVSHGDADGNLYFADQKLPLNDLSAADGKQWLDALRIQHQWVIVSACYSGQWIEALAAPSRAVFTSAAADRTSFGCSDDSERTWFSAALYGEALDNGIADPAGWFKAANQRVTEMEKEQGIEEASYSLPQSAVGSEFLRWWRG
ncbi:C13 family peptidase [Microbulbifer aggregans]|uniref:C13 family peptidase n=1 Tax=Microbulbifer aggregans TaxID=1769779 RepID=UPI001CFE9BBE|nr:C13 family peptidase [Microbulbifer aggregans]